MNKTTVETLFKDGLEKYLSDDSLSNVGFLAYFDYSMSGGWAGGAGAVKNGVDIGIASPDDATDALDEYFRQVKDTPDRFNRFVFELYADGTYKAEYLWDEEYRRKQRLEDVHNMPRWLLRKLPERFEYWGYGDYWQTGQITVSVKENKVFCEAYIIENGQKIVITQDIVKEFKNYKFESDILEDYEMTNFGFLKEVWNRGNWNKMIIHFPEKEPTSGIRFLDPDKDVEYIWEE